MWGGCVLATSGFPGFPPGEPQPCHCTRTAVRSPQILASWPWEGGFGGHSKKLLKSFVPGILPLSPLLTAGCQLNAFPFYSVFWVSFSFEHEVLFGHFAHGSDMCLLWGTICVGEVFIWDSWSVVILSKDMWQLSSGVWVCIPCVTGTLVAFCKMGDSGSTQKTLSNETMTKEK